MVCHNIFGAACKSFSMLSKLHPAQALIIDLLSKVLCYPEHFCFLHRSIITFHSMDSDQVGSFSQSRPSRYLHYSHHEQWYPPDALHQEGCMLWTVIWCMCKNNSESFLMETHGDIPPVHWEKFLLWCPQPGTGEYTHTILRPLSCGNSGVGERSCPVNAMTISPLLISSIIAH